MRKKRNYYSVLQLNRCASPEAIEAAYSRLARQYDPPTSKRTRAARRLQEIQEAYDVLSDKGRRAEYDRQRQRREAGLLGNGVEPLLASLRRRPLLFGGIAGSVFTTTFVLVIIFLAVLSGEDGEPEVGDFDSPPEITGEEITTDSGLKYIDIREGAGASPALGQTVVVHYTGWLELDGTKFDSSEDGGEPSLFVLGQAIEGWNEGLSTMQEGGERRLIIPPELAHGETGTPDIPPNSTLIFDVWLLEVRP